MAEENNKKPSETPSKEIGGDKKFTASDVDTIQRIDDVPVPTGQGQRYKIDYTDENGKTKQALVVKAPQGAVKLGDAGKPEEYNVLDPYSKDVKVGTISAEEFNKAVTFQEMKALEKAKAEKAAKPGADKGGETGKDSKQDGESKGEGTDDIGETMGKNKFGIGGALIGALLGSLVGGPMGAIIGMVLMALAGNFMDGKDSLVNKAIGNDKPEYKGPTFDKDKGLVHAKSLKKDGGVDIEVDGMRPSQDGARVKDEGLKMKMHVNEKGEVTSITPSRNGKDGTTKVLDEPIQLMRDGDNFVVGNGYDSKSPRLSGMLDQERDKHNRSTLGQTTIEGLKDAIKNGVGADTLKTVGEMAKHAQNVAESAALNAQKNQGQKQEAPNQGKGQGK